ncbi:MAG: CHAD domain-containing protein [Methanoregula sp.]
MTASKPVQDQTGTRFFCAGRLLPLMDAFTKEISGVRTAQDIEHIHRMRVASRRLRAALPLFASCFPPKKYEAWLHEIKAITGALGKARDMDVQIAFLQKYQKSTGTSKKRTAGRVVVPQHLPPDAIRDLLVQLQKQRARLQGDVVAALDTFERRRVAAELSDYLRQMLPANKRFRRRPSLSGIPLVAAERITNRITDLFVYEPWVHNPDAIAEHHALRIAAKKLRYTMEIYAPLYRLGLQKPIRQVKRLQEILGDIHDCDVWIDHLTLDITRHRARRETLSGASVSGAAAIPALKRLLADREQKRHYLYHRFVRFWDSLYRADFAAGIRQTLVDGRRVTCAPPTAGSPEAEENAVNRHASFPVDALAHRAHVAGLSLRFFDALRPVHGLPERDRTLLRYAALLHNIGRTPGVQGRRYRSDALVLADEELPFGFTELGIIGLVVRLSRKKPGNAEEGLFSLFSHTDRQRVLILAALLRVADGFDCLRQGTVSSLQVSASAHEITCDVITTGDATMEMARARAKSDRFARVFQKPLVIR